MPPPNQQDTATLMVNKDTGAIVAPVSVSLFRSANSLGSADSVHPHSDITGLTGGGATNLDGQATAGGVEDPGHTVLLNISSVAQIWQLQAGTDAEDVAGGVVRPDDYNASTNAVIWRRLELAVGEHAATHAAAGSDPVTLAQSQITNLTTDLAAKQPLATVLTNTTAAFTTAQETKLAGVATGATANSSDATLLARANHTGTQAISTVTGLQTALDAKAAAADLSSHTGNTSNPHSVTKAQVGLSNADNTSDANKPVSTATQTALDLKANLASPALTGTPTAPTAAVATDSTQIATTAFVHDAIAEIPSGGVTSVDGATGAVVTGYADRITALENVEPTASGSNLVSGGGVSLTGGLTLTVSAALYNILGVAKSSDETILTAATADPTNPRYDVVALDENGDAVLITGTPAATPVVPTVDPATQLYLTFISIPAGATSISGTETIIYDSNDDYTMTELGTSVVLNSSNNPRGGSGVCIEATTMVATDYFQAQTPSGTIDLGTFNVLRFFIRNKAAWHASKQITITARNNGVQVGQAVVFKHGLHAFDQTNVTTYQQISLNPNLFAAGGQPINQIRWTCTGGGSAITGFYVDDIVLQAGVSQSTDSTRLRDRGAHSTGLQYDVNDLAYSGAIIYKALQQTPVGIAATNTTYWTPFAMRNPMTTAGDSIVGGASGTPTRLAMGTSLQVLRVNAGETALEFGTPGAGDMLLGTAQTVTAAKTFNAGTLKIASGGDIVDANGNELFKFTATASAVNEVTYAAGASGNPASFTASGGDPDAGIKFATKGTQFFTFDGTNPLIVLSRGGTIKGYSGIAASTNGIITGSVTDDYCFYSGSGSGSFLFATNSSNTKIDFKIRRVASAVNGVEIIPAASGTSASIAAIGDDADRALILRAKGSHWVGIDGTNPLLLFARSGTTKAYLGVAASAGGIITGSATDDFCFLSSTSNSIIFSTDAGSTAHLKITGSTGAIVTTSSIQTGAPSGGTAAAWKHGTVATVSPTSPNRTIELDVNGTRYFLHAKTTND